MANNNWGWILLALGTAAASGLLVYSIMRSKEERLLAENLQLTQVVARRNSYIESIDQQLSNLKNVRLQYNESQQKYENLIAWIDDLEREVTDPDTKRRLRELKERARRQKLEQLAV